MITKSQYIDAPMTPRGVALRLALGVVFTFSSCWIHGFPTRHQQSRLVRRAVAEPPVRTRPPEVAVNTEVGKSQWTECLIKNPEAAGNGEANLRLETWIFRTSDYGDFEHLLKIRGFQNEGEQSSLNCRERQIDAEIKCSECVRLLRGGYYGHLGVSVPAYPPQPEVPGLDDLPKKGSCRETFWKVTGSNIFASFHDLELDARLLTARHSSFYKIMCC